jgi:trimethylamine---corrinoid protein Co-methyltransferase
VSDVQLGHEKTLTALVPALAGASLIYGSGMTESGVTFDPAQFVLDNEFARMTRFVVGGVPVGDATLLVDDVHAVGAFGDYLSLSSTLAGMRGPSTSTLLDRRVREDWEADGARDAYVVAREKALEIIENHTPEPVDADAAAQVRRIVAEVDARY